MDLDEILLTTEEAMEKAIDYLRSELRGVRTGRATTGLVDFVKIDYYGSPTDLRQLALVSVPAANQIVIKPYDPESVQLIVKGIQAADLGLNPNADGKQIRITIPALSGERRQEYVSAIKKMGEQAKVTVRNARRDGNKHVDAAGKDKELHLSEDDVETGKDEIQDLVKKYEKQIDESVTAKKTEIEEI